MMAKVQWPERGTQIRSKVRRDAMYSGYGSHPVCIVEPGQLLTVMSTDIPPVIGELGNYLTAKFMHLNMLRAVELWPGEWEVVE